MASANITEQQFNQLLQQWKSRNRPTIRLGAKVQTSRLSTNHRRWHTVVTFFAERTKDQWH